MTQMIAFVVEASDAVSSSFEKFDPERVSPKLAQSILEELRAASEHVWTVNGGLSGEFEVGIRDFQDQILNGAAVEDTALHEVLHKIVQRARSVIVWYGDDCRQLELMEDDERFVQTVLTRASDPNYEIYAKYDRSDRGE